MSFKSKNQLCSINILLLFHVFSGGYRHCEGKGPEIIIGREAREKYSPRLLFPLGHAHKTLAIARLSNRNAGFRHFWQVFVDNYMKNPGLRGYRREGGLGEGLGSFLYCIEKAYSPLSPPPPPPCIRPWSLLPFQFLWNCKKTNTSFVKTSTTQLPL